VKPNFSQLTYAEVRQIEADAHAGFENNGHSLLSPSGWHGWGKCVGSVSSIHNARAVGKDNCASVEGTAGHFFLEICTTLLIDPMAFNSSTVIPATILTDVRAWALSVSMKPHNSNEVKSLAVRLANDIINGTLADEFKTEIKKVTDIIYWYVGEGYTLIPEARVSAEIFLWHTSSDGTSDIVLYHQVKKHLIVADLKYGKGIEVFPKENGQLLIYCLGVISLLIKLDLVKDINDWFIDIVVCQPRINNRFWDAWQTNYAFMLQFSVLAKERSVLALYAIAYPKSVTIEDYRPSVNSCQFCHHRTNCQPRIEKAQLDLNSTLAKAGIVVTDNIPKSPNETPLHQIFTGITSDVLSEIYHAMPFILATLKDIEVEMYSRMLKGNPVKGVKLVSGRNARRWDIDDSGLEALLREKGIYDDCIEVKLPSPAKFEKILVDKGVKSDIMSHINKFKGSPVLALESDRRKSIEEIKNEESAEAMRLAGIVTT
jgi:hypothetical protein